MHSAKMAKTLSLLSALLVLFNIVNGQNKFERQKIESYQPCQYDGDCKENSFCYGNDDNQKGKCKCKDGFDLNRNTTFYECLRAVQLGEACVRDFQCQVLAGPMAICNQYQICECNELAHNYTDNLCYKTVKLTEPCLSDSNCKLGDNKFGYCTDGHCDCSLNQRPSPDLTKCLVSKNLGDICSSDDECLLISNAICSQVCSCATEYSISRDGRNCLKAASVFDDPCVEDGQCSKFLYKSICSKGNCSCPEGLHGYGNKCIRTVMVGGTCSDDAECVVDSKLEGNINCAEGICRCVYGVSDDSYGCLLKGFGSSLQSNLIIFVIGILSILLI